MSAMIQLTPKLTAIHFVTLAAVRSPNPNNKMERPPTTRLAMARTTDEISNTTRSVLKVNGTVHSLKEHAAG